MRRSHYLVVSIFFLVYLATWLPYTGVLNAPKFWGPLPQAMVWMLGLNVITTMIVWIVYFKFARPFARRMDSDDSAHPRANEVLK